MEMDAFEYKIQLLDTQNRSVEIKAISLDNISSPIGRINRREVCKIFGIADAELTRPIDGEIDILIGLEYAAYHPDRVRAQGHLVLYENRFGKTVGGSQAGIREETQISKNCSQVKTATVMHLGNQFNNFFQLEGLGVSCSPRCGSCACGTCHPGGKAMSLKDERELELIERGISFSDLEGRWVAEYPWVRDPSELANNRKQAVAKLLSTEKRLKKNDEYKVMYSEQIADLLDREVARRVTREELESYTGPVYYLAHHAVLKPSSKTTKCRIVFDSKASYLGLSLNDCLAKGPSLLNALLGVLLRFRQHQYAFIGDIRKMYHAIGIPKRDQMMHLFVWRNCCEEQSIETYAITAVNMGDRPSATIAQLALRKTAEEEMSNSPKAAKVIIDNSYMDDIPASTTTSSEASTLMREIGSILSSKGFHIKEWIHNLPEDIAEECSQTTDVCNGEDTTETEGVLGLRWKASVDKLSFSVKSNINLLNINTKRSILSTANSIFDPLGLLAPFTSRLKIVLRSAWAHEPKLDWDTELPEKISHQWKETALQIPSISKLTFNRSLSPANCSGPPMLIIFSDGSGEAYGAVAYIRWKLNDGSFATRLIMSKSRVAPLKIIDIVRLELCGAVLSARVRMTIQKETEFEFHKVVHFVDSEIVHAMINRDSYGFNTFVANRVGEIQQCTRTEEWAWIPGKTNIADVITRGSSISQIHEQSEWQEGPSFLKEEEGKWPAKFDVDRSVKIPELKEKIQVSSVAVSGLCPVDTLANRIGAERFSSWPKLVAATARILKLYQIYSKKTEDQTATRELTHSDFKRAEKFWIQNAQAEINVQKHAKLKPTEEDGVIKVGGRTERWMASTWNGQRFILLPKESHVALIIARDMHEKGGHLGVAASMSKVRSRYWIIGLRSTMKRIVRECRHCKEKLKALQSQIMSPLPVERLKPSPPFYTVGLDYFGPIATKGEVQLRTRGKAFGVIWRCFTSGAVHVDIAPNANTDGFLQAFRRFCSLRGWPAKIYSDKGTQLVGASNELKEIVNKLGWSEITKYGQPYQTVSWEFSPPDAKWYNGATESMVKSVKRALNAAVGDSAMQYSELQTVVFEAAQLVNERPIGLHPTHPEEGTYLCPNDLLLGRASSKIPQGPFQERCSNKHRHDFLQGVINAFWRRWLREVFPGMVVEPKWHTQQRDVREGDVVLVQDLNLVRGQWRMALVEEAIVSADGRVRRVMISYRTDEGTKSIVERPVQKLIVIAPKETSCSSTDSGGGGGVFQIYSQKANLKT